jgi:hypothetical protein
VERRSDTIEGALRLARLAFLVQMVALATHQGWHAVGRLEPETAWVHYLLLHAPLHVGVVILALATRRLWATARPSLPLGVLVAGVVTQFAGAGVDVWAVFGRGPHVTAAVLLASGGGLALLAAGLHRLRRRARPAEAA